MQDPRKKPFGKYLRLLADRMGLRDWTVGIGEGAPDDPNHNAEASPTYGCKIIWVYLSEQFLERSPEEQRQTLVHELIHAHLAPMHHLVCRIKLEDETFEAYKLSMEYAVDGMAMEWAKSLPLPPSPPKSRKN